MNHEKTSTSCNGRTNAVRDGSDTIIGRKFARRPSGVQGASCDSSRTACRDKHIKHVYIAGGSTERLNVGQKWIQRARAAGIEIAFDWTVCNSYDPAWLDGRQDGDVHRAWQGVARRDFEAVMAADVVWILVPEKLSEGAATELGIALAARALAGRKMLLVASGQSVHRNLFNRLANAQFDSHEAAFDYVRGLCSLRDGEPKEAPQYGYAP